MASVTERTERLQLVTPRAMYWQNRVSSNVCVVCAVFERSLLAILVEHLLFGHGGNHGVRTIPAWHNL